jgi:hypothetical protein
LKWYKYGNEDKYGGTLTDQPIEGTAGYVLFYAANKKGEYYIGHKEYYEYHEDSQLYWVWKTKGYGDPKPESTLIGDEPTTLYSYEFVKFVPLGEAPNEPIADYIYPNNHDWVTHNNKIVNGYGRKASDAWDKRTSYLMNHPELVEEYERLEEFLPKTNE